MKGFKKCCTCNAMNETDGDMNGSEEERNVRSECEKDEDTDCEDGDSNPAGKGKTECDILYVLSV
jgi:hypothetical protein